MKKCIVIPDSYKGTLSAIEVCKIMKESILKYYPDCKVIELPIADGGEGTVDSYCHIFDADRILVEAEGPYGEKIPVAYARTGDCAVIETASAAGLPMAEKLNRLDPCNATTYGLGTIMNHAIKNGCKKLIIGLGGSCTNDGGMGMAAALGCRFYNKSGEEFVPTACEFSQISRMDLSKARKKVKGIEVIGMCDIDNPMYGENGAAYVFAPQKGADEAMVKRLDAELKALSEILYNTTGTDVSSLKGGGAAGGLGAGLAALTNATLQSGIQTLLDLAGFDEMVKDSDLIFTGEGKIDAQSLRGKVVIGVAGRAKLKKIPVIAVVGAVGEDVQDAYDLGISAIFSINQQPVSFEQSRYHSHENLAKTMDNIIRFYKSIYKE